jgi:hypothetical protein
MRILRHFCGYIYLFIREYGYDAKRFVGGSVINGYNKTEARLLGRITLYAHAIEKGLAMKNMRFNFGERNVAMLISLCLEYSVKYDTNRTQYVNAVEILLEYDEVHRQNNRKLPLDIQKGIDELKKKHGSISPSHQPSVTKKEMFAHGDFQHVASNRYSVRNFSGPVDAENLEKALAMANLSPSSCNRQQCRIHVIGKGELFDSVLQIQNGNKGFGNTADKLLIVTTDVSSYNGINERNCPFIDGGIFVMHLLYCLQYYGIASCTLNCCFNSNDDKKLSKLLHTNEAFIAIIAIGDCPDELKVVHSQRITPEEYIIRH